MNGFDNTAAVDSIPWHSAPTSDSGLRAFARRHGFFPSRTTSGKWSVRWSSFTEAEEYDSAIEAIRAEIQYRSK